MPDQHGKLIRWSRPRWSAPGPDARYQTTESIELAFIAGLQRMPPRQAATLVLRDVLGFAADEVADMLGTSPAAVKGTLQRARAALDEHRSQAGRGRASRPDPDQERAIARRFAAAYVAADTQPALAGYAGAHGAVLPSGLFVLAMADTRIHAITRFHIDELYPRFGLARSLPEAGGRAGNPAR